MDLKALRYFVAAAEELHFGRAAARVGIAQPPLSIAIRKLETELDAPLFVRSTRRVELTDTGRELLTHARALLAATVAAEEAVRRSAAAETKTLRVGFAASSALGLLPEIVRAYRRQWPQVKLEIVEFEGAAPEVELRAGRIELSILRGPLSVRDLAVETLIRERLLVAMAATHPLARAKRIDLTDAANEPFVMFPRASAPFLFDTIVGACVAAGFSPKIVQEASTWAAVSSLVAAKLGITIAPASARFLRPAGLVFRSLVDERPRAEVVAVWPKGGLAPAAADFLASARNVFRRSNQAS